MAKRATNVLLSLDFLSFVSSPDGSLMHKELVNSLVMMQGEFEKVYSLSTLAHNLAIPGLSGRLSQLLLSFVVI